MAKPSPKRRAASRPSQAKKPAKRSPKPPARSPDDAFAWLAAQAWTRRAAAVQAEVDRACESPVWQKLGVAPSRDPATFERQLDEALRRVFPGRDTGPLTIHAAMAELESATVEKTAGKPKQRRRVRAISDRALKERILDRWRKFKADWDSFKKGDLAAAPTPTARELREELVIDDWAEDGSLSHFAMHYLFKFDDAPRDTVADLVGYIKNFQRSLRRSSGGR